MSRPFGSKNKIKGGGKRFRSTKLQARVNELLRQKKQINKKIKKIKKAYEELNKLLDE